VVGSADVTLDPMLELLYEAALAPPPPPTDAEVGAAVRRALTRVASDTGPTDLATLLAEELG